MARVTFCLLACALLAGDAGPVPSRVPAATASAAAESGRVPPFVLFGWVSPPVARTSQARLLEYAGCGLDLAMPAWLDSGRFEANAARCAWADTAGVACLEWDARLERAQPGFPSADSVFAAVVADYRTRPGFFGWYFSDEPLEAEFPLLAYYFAKLRALDPAHPSFNNLLPAYAMSGHEAWLAYARRYCDEVKPAILCNDHYDFLEGEDRGLFVQNLAGLRAVSREYGIPFWTVVQLIPHGTYRPLSAGELEWQCSMALAYGARGIGYFTYWTPDPDPVWNWQSGILTNDGERTAWYDVLANWNPIVRRAGETLAPLTWLATVHAGSLPIGATPFAADALVCGVEGRAAIGWFADAAGVRHALVANADSLASRTVTLALAAGARVEAFDAASGAWHAAALDGGANAPRLALPLGAGEFALVRFPGSEDGGLAAGAPPVLRAWPSPARRSVTFAVERATRGARLEVLDAGGRRVWGRDLGSGFTSIAWDGERDGGGAAPHGLYFVRVEDANGVAARRLVWLGR